MKTIKAILARRWFDGCNTYHSVVVVMPDGEERIAAFEYGYGDQWLQTALDLAGIQRPTPCRVGDVTEIYDVVDVTRRRDLHNRGRS